MEYFFKYVIFNNTVLTYITVFGTILLLVLAKRVISRFIAGKLLGWLSGRKKNLYQQKFLNLVIQPIEHFLIAFICITAFDRLHYPDILDFKLYNITAESIIRGIAVIIMVVFFIRLCLRIIEFVASILEEKAYLSENITDNQLIVFFKDFLKAIFIIIGILLIIRFAFNKDIGNVLTGLSIVGAGLALAAKESLENLIASFIIFFDKPFATGDIVKVLNFTGTVEKIGLRSTRIRTDQATCITVPNKQMVDTVTDNISLRTWRKVELKLELSLSATAQQLRGLSVSIKDIFQSKRAIEKYSVYLMDTGKTAHIMAIDFFVTINQTLDEFNSFREEINLDIIELIAKSGIQLAALSMDVVVKQS